MADTSSQSTTDIVLGATVSGRCVASVRGPAANNNQLRSPAVDLLEQHDAALRKAHARLCSHDLSARVTPALSGSLAASWPAQSVLMRLWPSSSCPFQFVRLLQRIWNITSTTCLPLLPQTAHVSLRLAFTTNLVSSWPSYLRKAGAFCILPDLAADTGSGGTNTLHPCCCCSSPQAQPLSLMVLVHVGLHAAPSCLSGLAASAGLAASRPPRCAHAHLGLASEPSL